MIKRLSWVAFVAVFGLVLFSAGCGGGKGTEEVVTTPPVEAPKPAPKPEPAPVEVKPDFKTEPPVEVMPLSQVIAEMQGRMRTVYFDFDAYDLSADARSALKNNADLLSSNPDVKVVVEGHCDERGTIEYNLALGERRASAVRDYLSSLGVNRSRMTLRSYGEERPAVRGSTEAAWSQNRRSEFKLGS